MESGQLLYPRLDRSSAQLIIHLQADMTLEELERGGSLSHPSAEPSATGGRLAPVEKLLEVQNAVRAAARVAAYPKPLASSTQVFDRACGTALGQIMEIVPADAAEEGVWSFLTLVVAPEIGPWRFPSRAEERLLGRPRNVLRRTWWRAWALGPDLEWAPDGCEPLGEDESVQIMERTTLGGNRRVAQAIQATVWRLESSGVIVARSELIRQLTRRLRAVKSHISLDALTGNELDELLDELAAKALHELSTART